MEEQTEKTLTEIYEELKKDFPKEAYMVDRSRGFDLTSVKAQYIVERLNEVLTVAGWELQGGFDFEHAKESGGVVYNGYLNVDFSKCGGPDVQHKIHAIGFSSQEKNTGDMLKKARTDALSKAASYLGVANEVFKGNVAGDGTAKKAAKPEMKQPHPKAKAVKVKMPETFQGKKPTVADF